jgi:hypothetical protein
MASEPSKPKRSERVFGESVPPVSTDDIADQPLGIQDVRDMQTTVGAASSGYLVEEDVDQARLRMHDVQVILTELDYLPIEHGGVNVDGVWGPLTRDAIAAFQADHGMPQNGQLDAETYEALLAAHESALEPLSGIESDEDEFNPMHPERPLQK